MTVGEGEGRTVGGATVGEGSAGGVSDGVGVTASGVLIVASVQAMSRRDRVSAKRERSMERV